MSLSWPTPPPPPNSPLNAVTAQRTQRSLEQRRGTVNRIQDMQARATRIHGFVKVTGGGGGFATVAVNFPVWFMEIPAVVFGWSLDDGQVLDLSNPPYFVAGVVRWQTENKPMHVTYWSGAVLGINGFGPNNTRAVVHWVAEANALRAPTVGSGAVTPETVL